MAPRDPPDRTVDPWDVNLDSQDALTEALRQTVDQLKILNQMQRQSMVGEGREGVGQAAMALQYQPKMREEMLKSLTAHGAIPTDPTAGMTKMSGWGALSSLQNAQAFAAQWFGQQIAQRGKYGQWYQQQYGEPFQLYQKPEQHGTGRGATPAAEIQTEPEVTVTPRRPAGPAPGQQLGQAVAGGAAGPVQWTFPPGQQAAQAQQAGRPEQELVTAAEDAASAAKSAARSAAMGEKEAKAGGTLGAAAQVAGEAVAEKLTPGKEHIPLPAEGIGTMPATGSGVVAPSSQPQPGGHGFAGQPPAGGGQPAAQAAAGGQGPPSIGFAQQLGARVAMTGGTTGGIMGLLKRIPGVGLVADVLDKAADVYTQQREAGRAFQEVEGGSNWAGQMERVSSLRYQVGMFGKLPEGVAAQMFGDVTGLGYNNAAIGQGQQLQNRTSALQFMYHNYLSTGTSMQQSAQILATASQNATVSLTTVASAMDSLSQSAGEAGTNAENARNNFNQYFNTVLQGAGAGPNAAVTAGGVATMQASYGNAFAGTNMSGLTGATEQYMLAGQTGLSPAQIQDIQRTNPGGYAQLVSGSAANFINQILGPQLVQGLQTIIQQYGGPTAIQSQPALAQQVGNAFLNQYQTSANIDLNVWATEFSAYSQTPLTAGNVMQWIVEQVAGNNLAANTQGGKTGTPTGAAVPAGQAGQVGTTGVTAGGAPTGQFGLAQGTGPSVAGRQVIQGKTWQQVLTGGQQGAAAQAYLTQEKKTNQRSPVMEALLQNVPPGAKVAVQTASGVQVMSFQDAVQYYPDELEAGTATFYDSSGKIIGSTGTITHGLTDPTQQQGATGEAATGVPKGVSATSIGQYLKQHPQQAVKSAGASGGSAVTTGGVTVDLSAAAQQLLKLLPTNSDNAAASATVPTNPNPVYTSR